MLGVDLSWTENGVGESWMVYRIRPLLGFQSQGFTITDRLAFYLAAIRAVEEVSAIELQTRLVCDDFHLAAGRRVTYGADTVEIAV